MALNLSLRELLLLLRRLLVKDSLLRLKVLALMPLTLLTLQMRPQTRGCPISELIINSLKKHIIQVHSEQKHVETDAQELTKRAVLSFLMLLVSLDKHHLMDVN
jgi:hypothetical protein